MSTTLDIRSKAPFPAGALSNFAAHKFTIDGITCASMEGFLQSLKIEDVVEQQRVCALVGETAQKAGRRHDWATRGTLWWRGAPIDRLSDAYQALLNRAYEALFAQSDMFRAALAATGDHRIAHTIGKSDPCDTILTTEEYCTRLEQLRAHGRCAARRFDR
jgi:predicted NAD-dependent protein-ADP-ribosyltransferase YbiA (DUF1768 family)